MNVHSGAYPALLLNADFSPLNVHPLSTLSCHDALKALFQERVIAVAEYDVEFRSARAVHRLPSVVALKQYVKVPRLAPFNRLNIWLRDGGRCAYCRKAIATHEVTFDHVVPKSRGGRADWHNIVCSCAGCNNRKGNRTPDECGMVLAVRAVQPTRVELERQSRLLGKAAPVNRDWRDWLYWSGELDPD